MAKAIGVLVLVLVVIYVATSPDHAANIADSVGGWLNRIVHGLGRFLDKIA